MKSKGTPPAALVKDQLAHLLKDAIMDGRLVPGQRVVESQWAEEFNSAQASVREAINLLIAEGFLVKDSGRSARVVNYREQDVAHIYEVRAALEGTAAELACSLGVDISAMDKACDRMAAAAAKRKMRELIQSDLDFHIGLVSAAKNPVLTMLGSKLLYPLFAFIQIRVLKSGQGPESWKTDLQYHRQMLQVIREGDANLAGQFVRHCVRRFAQSAYRVWENDAQPKRGRRSAA